MAGRDFCQIFDCTTGGSDEDVTTEPAVLYGVSVTPVAADATLIIKADSTEITRFFVQANGDTRLFPLPVPTRVATKIASNLTGANAKASVFYGKS